ncbi:hypothetical protein CYMTET_21014 [Cymbomonas tetramitiformis]|uniref:Right handed beta helix domain-containing protein n=1 Tax=Cymbomonas tetramitiformis TaxID=36881 RepID=A0AAE0G304_9CHLO|nr:hypothetical protein CYMTET_21014 [Cymbomonas tetramitiformis]
MQVITAEGTLSEYCFFPPAPTIVEDGTNVTIVWFSDAGIVGRGWSFDIVVHESPPPIPPPAPPGSPPLPPAPPFDTTESTVNINNSHPIYAASDLDSAIQNSNVDTIVLQTNISLYAELPPVSRALTILGDCDSGRCIIDGNKGFRVFAVEGGGRLQLSDLSLVNGNATEGGAVSARNASAITMHNCSLLNNLAISGGGIHLTGSSNLTMYDSLATEDVEVGTYKGGLLFMDSGFVLLQDCIFSAITVNAGALIVLEDSDGGLQQPAIIQVVRILVLDNTAFDIGGILWLARHGSIIIDGSFFGNNMSPFGGVMRANNEMEVTILNSAFVRNTAPTVKGIGGYGGVLRLSLKTSLLATDCLFEHNKASMESGALSLYDESSSTLERCVMQYNAAASGGVMTITNARVTVLDSVMQHNTALLGGGAYLGHGGYLIVAESEVSENGECNTTEGGAVQGALRSELVSTNTTWRDNCGFSGGALHMSAGNLTVQHSRFVGNHARTHGGALQAGMMSRLELRDVSCVDNHAEIGGGCAYFPDLVDTYTFSGCNVTSNTNTAIRALGTGNLRLEDCELRGNHGGVGGALSLSGWFNLTVSGSVLADNTARSGGALVMIDGRASFTTTEFQNNVADKGGAMVCTVNGLQPDAGMGGALLHFADCSLDANRANFSGGAVATDWCDVLFSRSRVSGNSAVASGGVLQMDGGSLRVEDCAVSENSCGYEGGVMWAFHQTVTHTVGSTFTRNVAEVRGGVIFTDGELSLENCQLEENDSSWGQLYIIHQSALSMRHTRCMGNTALGGGVIYCRKCSGIYVADVLVNNNTAMEGGGIVREGGGGDIILVRCAISNNVVTEYGGAILSFDSELHATAVWVAQSSLTGNWAHNGGVLSSRDTLDIRFNASYFAHNQAFSSGGCCWVSAGSTAPEAQYPEVAVVDSIWESSLAGHGAGGAVFLEHVDLTVNGSSLVRNMAGSGGGAVSATGRSTMVLVDSNLTDNYSTQGGAAMLLADCLLTIERTQLLRNEARTGSGGAVLMLDAGRFFQEGGAIVNNSAKEKGGGIAVMDSGELRLLNGKISGNRASHGGGLYMKSQNAPTSLGIRQPCDECN